jgi:KEOPS complex subunit Cgi121
MMDFQEEEVAMAGLRGPLGLDDALFQARKSSRIAPMQLLRADRVVGVLHLRSAAMHAKRAMAQGRAQANSIDVEFMRYAAGERQIKAALQKMGLQETNAAAAIVAFGPKRKDVILHFTEALGVAEDDRVLEATMDKLHAFGVTEKQLAATTPERHLDIVLEAVALVDLMRN